MTALDEFVKETAEKYLQSVVFVDDKIYFNQLPVDLDNIPPSLFSGLKSQFIQEQGGEEVDATTDEAQSITHSVRPDDKRVEALEGQGGYHPRELMESFARKGIVCALYEPT